MQGLLKFVMTEKLPCNKCDVKIRSIRNMPSTKQAKEVE